VKDVIDRGSRVMGLGFGEQKQSEPFRIIRVSEDVIPDLIRDLGL